MNIKTIIGLDLSISSTGLFVFSSPWKRESYEKYLIKTDTKNTMIERLDVASDAILSHIYKHSLVFLEGYSYGSFNTEVLAQLGGIIKVGVYRETGVAPIIVSPNTLKKFILGSGKGQGKEDIKLGAYKKWGIEFKTSDEIDAYALGRLGLQVCGKEKLSFEYERECIKALTKVKKTKKGNEKENPNTLELQRAGIIKNKTNSLVEEML